MRVGAGRATAAEKKDAPQTAERSSRRSSSLELLSAASSWPSGSRSLRRREVSSSHARGTYVRGDRQHVVLRALDGGPHYLREGPTTTKIDHRHEKSVRSSATLWGSGDVQALEGNAIPAPRLTNPTQLTYFSTSL